MAHPTRRSLIITGGLALLSGLAGCLNPYSTSGMFRIVYLYEIDESITIWSIEEFPFSAFPQFEHALETPLEIVSAVEAANHETYPDLESLHGEDLHVYNMSRSEMDDIQRALEPVPSEEIQTEQGILPGWFIEHNEYLFCITPGIRGG